MNVALSLCVKILTAALPSDGIHTPAGHLYNPSPVAR